MATLNDQLIKLKQYDIGFNIYEGTIFVSISYPKEWSIPAVEEDGIRLCHEEGKYYYCIPLEDDTNKIFELIDNTIKYNKEIEAKVDLLREKVNELKQLFVDETYETLLGLTFSFKKKGRRGNKKTEKRLQAETFENKQDVLEKKPENTVSDIDLKVSEAINTMPAE